MENSRLWRQFKTADFGHSNYDSVMYLTETYSLSTAGRVKLEFGNNECPSVRLNVLLSVPNSDSVELNRREKRAKK